MMTALITYQQNRDGDHVLQTGRNDSRGQRQQQVRILRGRGWSDQHHVMHLAFFALLLLSFYLLSSNPQSLKRKTSKRQRQQ